MQKALLIIGAIVTAAALICLSMGLLYRFAHRSMLDGTPGHYRRLRRAYRIHFAIGAGLFSVGVPMLILSFILRSA